MAKPIFIIEIPLNITKEQAINIQKTIEKQFPDYNTLGIQSQYSEEFKFNVFNCEESENIDLKSLKRIIKNGLNK